LTRALPPHEVGDHVCRRHRDDEIAEGHDLLTHRNDVAEYHERVGRGLEVTRAA
jgi:hypothetical protein